MSKAIELAKQCGISHNWVHDRYMVSAKELELFYARVEANVLREIVGQRRAASADEWNEMNCPYVDNYLRVD